MSKPIKTVFKDKWGMIIGIPIVAIICPLAFGHYIGNIDKETTLAIASSITSTLIMWLGVRAIVIYLWREYPWVKNPIKHLLIEIVAIFVYTAVVGFIMYFLYKLSKVDFDFEKDLPQNVAFTLMITFLITSIHEGIFFYRQWKTWYNRSEKLEEENIRSQYETLKSQINPHFLFNNLNTLASLIEESPKDAVDYVNRTADYYRKILNLRGQEIITISEELELVNDYFFLQKKRFGENLSISINIPEAILTTYVAPLTLQMLVENAIKHNIISAEKPLSIVLTAEKDLYIRVTNNLQKRDESTPSSKLGLKNITERYNYLSNSKVEIIITSFTFTVSVPVLKLNR
jgi:two-component system, LytTR family, sensor kinase